MLALEDSAAEILKDVEDSSPSVYTDIWSQLARRFGMTDGPREAMRRFDNRRQQDSNRFRSLSNPLEYYIGMPGRQLLQYREIPL